MRPLAASSLLLHLGLVLPLLTGSLSQAQPALELNTIPGNTAEERLAFLGKLEDHDPNRQRYYLLATRDQSADVRRHGAYLLRGDAEQAIPTLLHLMTQDADHDVRLSAAISLDSSFTDGGAPYGPKQVWLLEEHVLLIAEAVKQPTTRSFMVDLLDVVWCDMTEESRRILVPALESEPPLGNDGLAKQRLCRNASAPCRVGSGSP